MFFVLGTLTQDCLLSQIKRTNGAISFQEKARNKSSVSNCDLIGNFAFLYAILGIMFWAPGISVFLTTGRLPGAAFFDSCPCSWCLLILTLQKPGVLCTSGQEPQESQDTQADTAYSCPSL